MTEEDLADLATLTKSIETKFYIKANWSVDAGTWVRQLCVNNQEGLERLPFTEMVEL